jgi:predicted GNAT family N-acyltransferase
LKIVEVEHGSEAYWQAVELRREVLRRPLGLDFSDQQLSAEAGDSHLVALQDGLVVGCLVLTPRGSEVQMRQVAVRPDLQGQGIGRLLVEESEIVARRGGFASMVLHARDTAIPFYQRLGYTTVSDVYEEVGIPHRTMAKDLA